MNSKFSENSRIHQIQDRNQHQNMHSVFNSTLDSNYSCCLEFVACTARLFYHVSIQFGMFLLFNNKFNHVDQNPNNFAIQSPTLQRAASEIIHRTTFNLYRNGIPLHWIEFKNLHHFKGSLKKSRIPSSEMLDELAPFSDQDKEPLTTTQCDSAFLLKTVASVNFEPLLAELRRRSEMKKMRGRAKPVCGSKRTATAPTFALMRTVSPSPPPPLSTDSESHANRTRVKEMNFAPVKFTALPIDQHKSLV